MKGIGTSFLSRARVARDFESSDSVMSFLSRRGLINDIDRLNDSALRLKSSAEEAIQDAFYSIFSSDLASDLEVKLLASAKFEIRQLRGSPVIQTYVTYTPINSYSNLSVRLIYQHGSQTMDFEVFSSVPPVTDADLDFVMTQSPAIAWLIDEQSPLFSPDAVKNLKIHLYLERLLMTELTREDRQLIRLNAKEILRLEEKKESSIPENLANSCKTVVALIRHQSNLVEPDIDVVKHYRPLANGRVEYQILIQVEANQAEAFTYAMGIRLHSTNGKFIVDEMAVSAKAGKLVEPWADLFESEYLKDSLNPDPFRIKYILNVFKYREANRRTEKLVNELIQAFPEFDLDTNGDVLKIYMNADLDFESRQHDKLRTAFWIYKKGLERFAEFCTEKDIFVSGSFGFKDLGEPDSAPRALPVWEITDNKIVNRVSDCKCGRTLVFESRLILVLNRKSKIKFIRIVGKMAREAIYALDLVRVTK